MSNNFTPIEDFLVKYKKNSLSTKNIDNISYSNKEIEPISREKIEVKEVVEHKVDEEVKPYVSVRHETIELPPDLKKLGLQSVTSSQFSSYQTIKLPLSDEKIIMGLHAPITSSLRWLATLSFYLLQKAHLTIKVVGRKIIRVLQP
ncbi:MAG: hypothetical protein ACPLRN_02770 [Microgenomates group bacterium]